MNDIPESAQESKAPSSSVQARPRSANVGRIALIVALVLLVAAAASIGKLAARNQSFTLSYASNGVNLIGAGDTIEITLEHGAVSLPTGKVLLSAAFPPRALVYVRNLLVSFATTPGRTGLLVGLLEQSPTLNP